MSEQQSSLPTHARVVIIGGGSVGCSSLYHLAKAGWTDSVLLEKSELTSGSTWHAAGNCPNFAGSLTIMKMQNYSTRQYATLGQDVDYPMNYHQTGAVRISHSRDRTEEFKHVASLARVNGIELDMISMDELKGYYPFIETHDLDSAQWDPTDGDIDPSQLSQAYAKGARDLGAKIVRNAPVTNIERLDSGEWEITTPQGKIRCEKFVNAAGYRAREIGAMVGRDVPCTTMAHQYLVSEQLEALTERGDTKLPLLRDPDSSYYLRQERDGLLLGPYEWNCKAHWVTKDDPMPDDFSFQLYPDDLERLEWYIEDAIARVPILGTAGIQKVINGPIPYTPDGLPLIGPMPGVPDAFEACVFTFGIVQAGGAGKILSEWVIEGETDFDCWAVDPRRFKEYATPEYTHKKAIDVYQYEYEIGFPHVERNVGRPAKTSPLYYRLKADGGKMGFRGGWERALYFAEPGTEVQDEPSYHREQWFETVGKECKQVAETAGILDLPGFARYELKGKGAAEWLDKLTMSNLPKAGRIGLLYFATPKGLLYSEMSVTRFSEDHFWLISGAPMEWRDMEWLSERLPADGSLELRNVTDEWQTLVLTGPNSRAILGEVCPNELDNKSFPWLSHQPVQIGMGTGHAIRVSYAGELGWEIHMPTAYLAQTYEFLKRAGEAHGLIDFGMYALDSMRLEKGYRALGHEISVDFRPNEAVGSRFINMQKPDFVGREAMAAAGEPRYQLVLLKVDTDDVEPHYLSNIRHNGEDVGLITSGGYGHRIGASLAIGFVPPALAAVGTELELELLGDIRKCVVVEEPVYDPTNALLRG